ncbi:hypothetical protein QWY93_06890 [Echinicola jeungdonensis]|uniref:NIPSNAP domain-containing protein n=1 Tax=Echinicola jeungdonensis TaxID=709343 RepID=A0ABV5J257_9BACT|nr:hypothetical protein [Echinicola jeungdonensis]MDN3669048.1 hypothetical protein [Echinicola jeungdonensis]
MKKLFAFIFLALFCGQLMAQDKFYAILEFMEVENDKELDYLETEKFWEKIHKKRIEKGDIIGWDLWHLKPGGEDQQYQYMVVTMFDSPVKMLQAGENIREMASMAYPDFTDDMIRQKFNNSITSRELSERYFVEVLKETNGSFVADIGSVAAITFMHAHKGNFGDYEKAEKEVFYPVHQKMVDNGIKGYWGLGRIIIPYGSKAKASHLTVNMYKDYSQFVNSLDTGWEDVSDETKMKAEEGRKTRDLNWVYLGKLIRMVR